MTYEKQEWANGAAGGTPLSADRLNYMEDGIEDAASAADGAAPAEHSHVASSITSGTFAEARIPSLAISKITGLEAALDELSDRLDLLEGEGGDD